MISRIAGIFLSLLLFISFAFADGESRKATEKEKAFHKKVSTVLSGVLPPAPEGWSEAKDEISDIEWVGAGSEKTPFKVFFRVEWNDVQKKQTADEEMQKALLPIMQDPGRQAEIKKLTKENDLLAKQFGEAIGKNDQPAAERLGKETEEQRKKMQVVFDAQDKEMDDAMEKHSAHDVNAVVQFSVNEVSVHIHNSASPESPVGGFQTFRTKGEWTKSNGWREGTTTVLLGNGFTLKKYESEKYFEAAAKKGVPNTTVQTIVITVQADASRAKQILGGMKWNTLKELLVK